MKTGISLQDLATNVSEQRKRIVDFEANTSALSMDDDAETLTLREAGNVVRIRPNELFHSQLADKVGIPLAYYNKCLRGKKTSSGGLLAQNVNHWLSKEPANRLVRTYLPTDDAAPMIGRAFLGERYRPLDNYSLMGALLPPLMDTGMTVRSCDVTDEKLYLQCVTDRITAELKVGEPVNMGLVVTNSETGCGALSIQVLIYVCRCTNGMVIPADDTAFRKTHVGGRLFSDSDRYLTVDTRNLRDQALWAEARDVIKAAVTESSLNRYVGMIQGTMGNKLTDPMGAVQSVSRRYGFVAEEQNGIMQHLIAGGDASQWGLIQAVTRTAQDVPSYDRAFELQRIGGRMLALRPSDLGAN